jgi:hypothetical protein
VSQRIPPPVASSTSGHTYSTDHVIDVRNVGNRRRHGLAHSADWRAGASTASFSDGTQDCDAVKALMLQADEPHPVAVRQPVSAVRPTRSQRLMHSTEVVVQEVQRNCVSVVLSFLGESVGEPGETEHTHAHRYVLAAGSSGCAARSLMAPTVVRFATCCSPNLVEDAAALPPSAESARPSLDRQTAWRR